MDKNLEKYYEARFSMFADRGWKDLVEDIDARIKIVESIKGVDTIEKLWARKGELDTLEWLKSLPEVSQEVYNQLKDEDTK